MSTVKSKSALAAALGIHRTTLYTWLERGIVPPGPPWDLNQCRAAAEEHELERDSGDGDGGLRDALDTAQAERIRGRIADTQRKRERAERRLDRLRRDRPRREILILLIDQLTERTESTARRNLENMKPPELQPGEDCKRWIEQVHGMADQYTRLHEWPVTVRNIVSTFIEEIKV